MENQIWWRLELFSLCLTCFYGEIYIRRTPPGPCQATHLLLELVLNVRLYYLQLGQSVSTSLAVRNLCLYPWLGILAGYACMMLVAQGSVPFESRVLLNFLAQFRGEDDGMSYPFLSGYPELSERVPTSYILVTNSPGSGCKSK